MGEDWAVYSKQSPWREAEEQSAHFERDHACAQERMSMGRLSAGIWAGQDGLQSLQPLECAGKFGRASWRRRPNLVSRRNEWLSTARISKPIAVLAAEKGGVGPGDWHHQGRAQQQDSRPCR